MNSELRIGLTGGTTAPVTGDLPMTVWATIVWSMTELVMGILNGVLWYVSFFFSGSASIDYVLSASATRFQRPSRRN